MSKQSYERANFSAPRATVAEQHAKQRTNRLVLIAICAASALLLAMIRYGWRL